MSTSVSWRSAARRGKRYPSALTIIPPVYPAGAWISLGALALLLLYLLLLRLWDRRVARKRMARALPAVFDADVRSENGTSLPGGWTEGPPFLPPAAPPEHPFVSANDQPETGEGDGFDLYRYYPAQPEKPAFSRRDRRGRRKKRPGRRSEPRPGLKEQRIRWRGTPSTRIFLTEPSQAVETPCLYMDKAAFQQSCPQNPPLHGFPLI